MKISTENSNTDVVDIINTILDIYIRDGKIKTEDQYDSVKSELEIRFAEKYLQLEYREQSNKTNSKNYTSTNEEVIMDLITIFKSIDNLDKSVIKQMKVNESILNTLWTQVQRSEDELDNLSEIRRELFGADSFVEAFRSASNIEEDVEYYKGRFGEQATEASMVAYDKMGQAILSPSAVRLNILHNENGVSFAKASVKMQLGSALKADNLETGLDNVLDTSLQTYWQETILTNSPMNVPLNEEYYNIDSGAVCAVEIKMETATIINEFSMEPKSPYPMEIVGIRYYETDDDEEAPKDILFPDNPNERLRSKHVESAITIRFDDVLCKKLVVILNQIHYVKSNYFFDKKESDQQSMLQELKGDPEPVLGEDDVFKPVYNDRAVMDKAWVVMNNMLKDKGEITLDMLMGNDDRKIPVNKYSYIYGATNMGVYFNDYQNEGIYVSKTIKASKGIHSLTMETEELHEPINNKILTDIEMYVTLDEAGAESEWIPVFPSNKEVVECELLQEDPDSGRMPLRFRPTSISAVRVYENQKLLIPGIEFEFVMIGGREHINILPASKPTAIYTASYPPNKEAKIVPVMNGSKSLINALETIQATGGNVYDLSNKPFLHGKDPNITITTEAGELITQESSLIRDVTDKANPKQSYLNFSGDSIQYYITDDQIYFNQSIGEADIRAEYQYYPDRIRVKAILRKNTHKEPWAVPVLNMFKVKFSVL